MDTKHNITVSRNNWKWYAFLLMVFVIPVTIIMRFFTPDSNFKKPTEPITRESVSKVEVLADLGLSTVGSGEIEFSDDSTVMAISNADEISIWSANGGKIDHIRTIPFCGEDCQSCCYLPASEFALSPNGELLVTSYSGDIRNEVQLWNVKTGNLLESFEPYDDFSSLEFSSDSTFILYHSGGSPCIWNIKSGQFTLIEEAIAWSVTFDSNSNDIFYLAEKQLKKWDANTTSTQTLNGGWTVPERFEVSSDGSLLAVLDGTELEVYDVETLNIRGHIAVSHSNWNITFSSNDQYVILTNGHSVEVWNFVTDTLIFRLDGKIYDITYDSIMNPDSDLLVFYQSPYTVRVFDLEAAEEIAKIKAENLKGPLRFSPDGTFLVSLSGHVLGSTLHSQAA